MTAPGLALDLRAALALAGRDLRRFFRQKSRIAGALGQPLVLWAIYGLGLGGSFRVAGAERVSYLQYLFPGVLVVIVLFTAIFSTMSVIEDRHAGFLQVALVAPMSRGAIALGKALGGAAIALAQGAVFLALAPLAHYRYADIAWGNLALVLSLGAIGITAIGFAFAWALDSIPGYHGVMMLLLVPMWVLSGAMFPVGTSAFGSVMRANPMTYVVDGVRHALAGGDAPEALFAASAATDLAVVAAFAAVSIVAATAVCARRR